VVLLAGVLPESLHGGIMKISASPEAEEIIDSPFSADDVRACEQFLNRFEHVTTALYLIAAHMAAEFEDDEAAEIVAAAVVNLAEHEAKR
jgi:hypothetical protein